MPVQVDDSFTNLSSDQQDAAVDEITKDPAFQAKAAQYTDGTNSNSFLDPWAAKPMPPTHNPLAGLGAGAYNALGGVADIGSNIVRSLGLADPHATTLGDWAHRQASNVNYSPAFTGADIANNPLDVVPAAGERMISGAPMLTPAGAISYAAGAYGNTLDARSANNGGAPAGLADYAAAVAPAAATYALGRVAGGASSGLAGAALQGLKAAGVGALGGAAQYGADTLGTDVGSTGQGYLDSTLDGAANGLGLAAGPTVAKTPAALNHGAQAALGGGGTWMASRDLPDLTLSEAARVAQADDDFQRIRSAQQDLTGRTPADSQVFAGMVSDAKSVGKRLNSVLQDNGYIDGLGRDTLDGALQQAAAHTNELNPDTQQQVLDLLQQGTGATGGPDPSGTVLDLNQYLNTLSQNRLSKNSTGPYEALAGTVGKYLAGAGLLYSGQPLLAAGALMGGPMVKAPMAWVGRALDNYAGTRVAVNTLQAAKARALLAQNGVDVGQNPRSAALDMLQALNVRGQPMPPPAQAPSEAVSDAVQGAQQELQGSAPTAPQAQPSQPVGDIGNLMQSIRSLGSIDDLGTPTTAGTTSQGAPTSPGSVLSFMKTGAFGTPYGVENSLIHDAINRQEAAGTVPSDKAELLRSGAYLPNAAADLHVQAVVDDAIQEARRTGYSPLGPDAVSGLSQGGAIANPLAYNATANAHQSRVSNYANQIGKQNPDAASVIRSIAQVSDPAAKSALAEQYLSGLSDTQRAQAAPLIQQQWLLNPYNK